jgi:hypothetical protein
MLHSTFINKWGQAGEKTVKGAATPCGPARIAKKLPARVTMGVAANWKGA